MSPRLERAALPKLLAHPAYRRHAKTEKLGNLASALASLVELENPPPHRDRNGSHGPTLSHNHVSVKLHHLWKCSKRCVELAAKDATEHRDGKKEIVAWFDPAGVIGGQSTGWHQAMDMRVGRELLTPGMQNAAEADFRTEVLGIAGHFEKSFRTGAKQEIVEDFLVLQDQGGQRTRKRENHMDVTRGEKLLATRCEPAVASSCLALWTVPIAAGVVGDGAMSAAGAFIEMSAERGGATPRNGQEHFNVLPGDPLTASFDECVSRSADQIGHLE